MIRYTDINSAYWQLSLGGIGNVVQAVEDINQCILIIVTTRKGADPFRPNFGCGIFELLDRPINLVIAEMCKSITDAIALFETRIVVTSVTYEITYSSIDFSIGWKLKQGLPSGSITIPFGVEKKFLELPTGFQPAPQGILTSDEDALTTQSDNIIQVD